MKNCIKHIALIFAFATVALLLLNSCYKEEFVGHSGNASIGKSFLSLDAVYGIVDTENNFMLYTIALDTLQEFSPLIHFKKYSAILFRGQSLSNDQVNNLGEIIINKPYKVRAEIGLEADTFDLIFTRLPLMHIISEEKIIDDSKVLMDLEIQYPNERNENFHTTSFSSYAGVEYRGATSQKYDKKSFGIELWQNLFGNDLSTSLLGMHPGEDWILDAMYIDDLRMRNKISFELWEKMAVTPVEDHKPEVFPGIHCKYVELFINNKYHGLYSLDEKLDENLLHFSDKQGEMGGVLYKAIEWGDGSTTFNNYNSDPPNNDLWDGWELIYPSDYNAWDALAQLRQHIVYSSDEDFINETESFLDIDNVINYFLLINLSLAADNTGKNTYLARYTEHSRFFIMPWDTEASWGIFWDRTRIGSTGIVTNHLYDRLMSTNACDFNDKIHKYWQEYRSNIFSDQELMQLVHDHYYLIKTNGVIERENDRWNDININYQEEYEYLCGWISARLQFLDDYFGMNE